MPYIEKPRIFGPLLSEFVLGPKPTFVVLLMGPIEGQLLSPLESPIFCWNFFSDFLLVFF